MRLLGNQGHHDVHAWFLLVDLRWIVFPVQDWSFHFRSLKSNSSLRVRNSKRQRTHSNGNVSSLEQDFLRQTILWLSSSRLESRLCVSSEQRRTWIEYSNRSNWSITLAPIRRRNFCLRWASPRSAPSQLLAVWTWTRNNFQMVS